MGHAGGQAVTSIYQLSDEARNNFLRNHDPMISLGLNSETPLYRTTQKKYIKNGMIAGNPNSKARIGLYEEPRLNPLAAHYDIPADQAHAYLPRQIRAYELPQPSLNVIVGPGARNAISGYAKGDHVAVQMRLGDFLEHGGKVYNDVSAIGVDDSTSNALIVTLPKGKKVPVQVLDD
ncbi:AvrPphF family type III effector [Erwinia mallotivora]|uniref:AvrPphF family type III effector n=1 Tax=Erwinia mallotivora TaxID=69222 RepID=UPI0035E9EDF5